MLECLSLLGEDGLNLMKSAESLTLIEHQLISQSLGISLPITSQTEIAMTDMVNEADMRSFFDRIATQFVSLSEQARELSDLKVKVDDMNHRLDTVTNENERLRTDLKAAWEVAYAVEKERDEARKTVQERDNTIADLEYRMASLREVADKEANIIRDQADKLASQEGTIAEMRTTIQDLQGQLSQRTQQHAEVTDDRDQWQRAHSELTERHRNVMTALQQERDVNYKLESKAVTLEQRLNAMREKISEFTSLMAA
jgi:chromosome segregation ATPase